MYKLESDPPGRHFDPTDHEPVHITVHDLKCLGAFLLVVLILWFIHRVATGKWGPPPNGGGW